jgi:hypothetical protein
MMLAPTSTPFTAAAALLCDPLSPCLVETLSTP